MLDSIANSRHDLFAAVLGIVIEELVECAIVFEIAHHPVNRHARAADARFAAHDACVAGDRGQRSNVQLQHLVVRHTLGRIQRPKHAALIDGTNRDGRSIPP